MRVFCDPNGEKIYLADRLGIAGLMQQKSWTLRNLWYSGEHYRFPDEKRLLEFITWAEATIPPWKSVKEFIR